MSTLSELADWYAQHCDGDWEHGRGIRVETIANPGWMIRVDLAGTGLENRPFEAIAHAGHAHARTVRGDYSIVASEFPLRGVGSGARSSTMFRPTDGASYFRRPSP